MMMAIQMRKRVAVGRDPADPTSFPNEAPVIIDQEFTIKENAPNGSITGAFWHRLQ